MNNGPLLLLVIQKVRVGLPQLHDRPPPTLRVAVGLIHASSVIADDRFRAAAAGIATTLLTPLELQRGPKPTLSRPWSRPAITPVLLFPERSSDGVACALVETVGCNQARRDHGA